MYSLRKKYLWRGMWNKKSSQGVLVWKQPMRKTFVYNQFSEESISRETKRVGIVGNGRRWVGTHVRQNSGAETVSQIFFCWKAIWVVTDGIREAYSPCHWRFLVAGKLQLCNCALLSRKYGLHCTFQSAYDKVLTLTGVFRDGAFER